MKTETTKVLEKLLMGRFDDRSNFYCFECTVGWYGKEIVDCINYTTNREIECYEIKSSVRDFRSKSAKTFIGHKNYFVMPYSVYEKVKDEIPEFVGVFVAVERVDFKERDEEHGKLMWAEWVDGLNFLHCIKSAKRVDLKADKEVILSSMLRCMQRDLNRGSRFGYSGESV